MKSLLLPPPVVAVLVRNNENVGGNVAFERTQVFVYFQPGNGKVKIKEPIDQVKIAVEKLDEILEELD